MIASFVNEWSVRAISKFNALVSGLQDLSLISRHALFLCDSGDEIRSLSDRCNIKPAECADRSDEKDCNECKLQVQCVCLKVDITRDGKGQTVIKT